MLIIGFECVGSRERRQVLTESGSSFVKAVPSNMDKNRESEVDRAVLKLNKKKAAQMCGLYGVHAKSI